MIDHLVDAGHPVKVRCRLLGVSSPGYYQYKHRPLSPTAMRRQWLTGLIREVHTASPVTYGSRRVHAKLTRGMDVVVSENLVAVLMNLAGIAGRPGPAKVKKLKGIATAAGLPDHQVTLIWLAPRAAWKGAAGAQAEEWARTLSNHCFT